MTNCCLPKRVTYMMDHRTGSQDDLLLTNNEGSYRTYLDWKNWSRKQLLIVSGAGTILLILVISIITVIAVYSGSSMVVPTTPIPVTSTTTSTTPMTTTTTSTTIKPTNATTTTPSPTTTNATTTTPSPTTTNATTTTPSPTTTNATTTTPIPTTTNATTTTPSPTTTNATTTTPSPTTTNATTTTPTPATTNATTTQVPFHPSTLKPLPPNAVDKPPVNLLQEMGMNANFTEIPCVFVNPPSFKYQVNIQGHDYFGESLTKQHAKTASAITAVESMFGLHYPDADRMPLPKHPCIPAPANKTELFLFKSLNDNSQESSIFVPATTIAPFDDSTTTFHPSTVKPLPPNALDKPPVNLLVEMGMNPNFTEIRCVFTNPPTFKFQVDIQGHDYFGEASTRQHAKTASAIAANEALFDLNYPDASRMPLPKYPCVHAVGDELSSSFEVEH